MSITYELGLREPSNKDQRPLEYCFNCDDPTGKAGQGDGSLYCECDKGPFCEDCWDIHHNADTKVADLLDALYLCKSFFTVLDDGIVGTEITDAVDKAIAKAKIKQ